MSKSYKLNPSINLHIEGRISLLDAQRQMKTAEKILERFRTQPGVILADEVGMGKTFVALAVAASVALDDRSGPVVIMVPSSLKDKWPGDFNVFRERLPEIIQSKLQFKVAERPVEFLKLLDGNGSNRPSIIFLTHGAMGRGLTDSWVKLAVIQRALKGRKEIYQLKGALYRIMGRLLGMGYVERTWPEVWETLLNRNPSEWLDLLRKKGLEPEDQDDPVPESVIHALEKLELNSVFETLKSIPIRESRYLDERIAEAKNEIQSELKEIWADCVKNLKLRLPLLILDEAHHLKNAQTRFASLFQDEAAGSDADQISKGPLGGVFEKMLFLTATPFQLGHFELCSVLERFSSVAWPRGDRESRDRFLKQVSELNMRLDLAQESAIRLDNAWATLSPGDLRNGTKTFLDPESWWKSLGKTNLSVTENAKIVLDRFKETKSNMRSAESLLRPWVIRHLRPRVLRERFVGNLRRERLIGSSILPDGALVETGLKINDESLLPFLLAARAIACSPSTRAVFAEGLASSYEAFLFTKKQRDKTNAVDADDLIEEVGPTDPVMGWYMSKIEETLPLEDIKASRSHPKLKATIDRCVDLWKKGEKVLVFCHYIATGRALRQGISAAILEEIEKMAADKLGVDKRSAAVTLERMGKRFFDDDSPIRRACDKELGKIVSEYPSLEEHHDKLVDLLRRNLRAHSYLVRYFPLKGGKLTEDSVRKALQTKDGSDLTLSEVIHGFLDFLSARCGKDERVRFIEAVSHVRTGLYAGTDTSKVFSRNEIQGDRIEKLIPNVRLCNGQVDDTTRKGLMLTFNTPFFPEILVASSVMAEGVDLHLSCRHVIHHDLCWNPSTLEQRTGRVDRIGAKVEQCGKAVQVYLPFLAATQDEKMYRVVMDRERWFTVVMGEKFKIDSLTTEKLAARLPLPEEAALELALNLDVWSDSSAGK